VSDYEIEFLVPRNEFRSALEEGCVICSGIYGLNKNQTFQILDYDGPNDDGPDLVQKVSATKCAEGGPYDLAEITISIIGENGEDATVVYEVYADQGNTLLSDLWFCSRAAWANSSVKKILLQDM
jgi:hypothetical protein